MNYTEGVADRDEQMTTAMLKAYAHQLRRAIMRELNTRPYARAVDLAETLGESPNKLGFHLKQLAAAGLIEQAPEFARDTRDRVWRASVRQLRLGTQEADREKAVALVRNLEAEHTALSARAFAAVSAHTAGQGGPLRGAFGTATIKLTEAEFKALWARMFEELAVFEKRQSEEVVATEAQTWEVQIVAANDIP